MKLIVGLGNPGPKYQLTRHNLGFLMLDWCAEAIEKSLPSFRLDKSAQAEVWKGRHFLYVKPMTYMNLSGTSVQYLCQFHKLNPATDLIIFHDDLDLSFFQMKLKFDGGSAGQKGIADTINKLGDRFARLRLGIGRPTDQRFQISDYVLSKLSTNELDFWKEAASTVAQGIEHWDVGNLKRAQEMINSYKPK